MKRLKTLYRYWRRFYTKRQITYQILLGYALMVILTLCFGCSSVGRPLLNQPQFGLYDDDGRYVIAYPYAHNPRKFQYIPFIDPDYGKRR